MSTPTRSILAEVLARCAEEEGGVRALAREIEVSPQTLHDLIAGRRRPGKHVARAIADYLGGRPAFSASVAPADILEWSGWPP